MNKADFLQWFSKANFCFQQTVLKSAHRVDGRIIKDWFTCFCVTSPLLCHLQYSAFLENILEADVLSVPQASTLAEVDWSSAASVTLFIIFWWASFTLSLSLSSCLFSQQSMSTGRENTLTLWRPKLSLLHLQKKHSHFYCFLLFFAVDTLWALLTTKTARSQGRHRVKKRDEKQRSWSSWFRPMLFANRVVLIFTWKWSRSTWTLGK